MIISLFAALGACDRFHPMLWSRLMGNNEGEDVRGALLFQSGSNAGGNDDSAISAAGEVLMKSFPLPSLTQGYGPILLNAHFYFHHQLFSLSSSHPVLIAHFGCCHLSRGGKCSTTALFSHHALHFHTVSTVNNHVIASPFLVIFCFNPSCTGAGWIWISAITGWVDCFCILQHYCSRTLKTSANSKGWDKDIVQIRRNNQSCRVLHTRAAFTCSRTRTHWPQGPGSNLWPPYRHRGL